MTVKYQKVWTTMNDLEMVTSKICSAREIIDAAVDRIQEHQYDKAETMMSAAYEFLEYYLQEFDEKFKFAWQATVGDLRSGDEFQYTATGEKFFGKGATSVQYTEEELNAMCDKAEADEKKKTLTLNYQEAIAAGWTMTDDGIWMPPQNKKKWVLPVEQVHDDYFVSFPQDLLEAAKLKEGDQVEWVDNKNGTYTIRKSTQPLGPDEC